MAEWFESFFDDLAVEYFGHAVSAERVERSARTIQALLGLEGGDSVLDVPCGIGRLAVPLAGLGLRVTGVDFSRVYLDAGRAQAAAAGLSVRFIERDMRKIDFVEAFDGALNWGGSFGYFSDADNLRYCHKIGQALRPGGRFLLDTIHEPWLAENCRPHTDVVLRGIRIRQMSRYDRASGRYRALWTYTKGRERRRHHLSMRVYTEGDLRKLLRQAGFAEVECLGGPPPVGPLGPTSRRMLTIATRPPTTD
ncbi:MAG: SAM-dependent methyltransferase [Planctomycetota bacterium]